MSGNVHWYCKQDTTWIINIFHQSASTGFTEECSVYSSFCTRLHITRVLNLLLIWEWLNTGWTALCMCIPPTASICWSFYGRQEPHEISKGQVRRRSTRLEWRGFSSSVQCCTPSNIHDHREEEGQLEFHFSMMKFFSSCLFCITKVHKMYYIWQSVAVNWHKKAVFPTHLSISKNSNKHSCTISAVALKRLKISPPTTASSCQMCMSH